MWSQLELTPAHLTYLSLSAFLIVYALFSNFIRNRLHLSEPPLALLFGIICGPAVLGVLRPIKWGLDDNVLQEVTRVIVAIQCFAVGLELPKLYFERHWRSVAWMLGPVMIAGWVVTSSFAYLVFQTTLPTAMIIGAALAPTDPILAASITAQSRFSGRVPSRLKHLLSAESACNDGVSFPFLYAGIVMYTKNTTLESVKEWILITLLWQVLFGITVGIIIGVIANRVLRFTSSRNYSARPSFIVFYLLLAILAIGVGSTLGSDDFLVAFGAGLGFSHDGWFAAKIKTVKFPVIIDLMLNSSLFVFFGAIIPWKEFVPRDITPNIGIGKLFLFLALVLMFRRIPVMLICKPLIPDIRTYYEALFCGHFGPMGVGALFLAIEAMAQLENGTSLPDPERPSWDRPYTDRARAVELVWPVICFVVLGSVVVHGISVAAISIGVHYTRKEGERAPLIGSEVEGLPGMHHDGYSTDSEPPVSGDDSEHSER